MHAPKARGDVSEALVTALQQPTPVSRPALVSRPTDEDDLHIALWTMYELCYRGFEDVADDLEWDPAILELRGELERRFEDRLRADFAPGVLDGRFVDVLSECIEADDGRSVAAFMQRDAGVEHFLEFLRFKSIYHLKEADPTAWVVPRLPAGPKAALMELQYDEYGCGDPNRLHANVFVRGLRACGLRPEYGAYIDDAPVEVLMQNNAWSLFGLHRRLRGAAVGHLAAFEATSSLPSRKISQGLARLDMPPEIIAYYDEHVEADAVHEQLAIRAICDALVAVEPGQAEEVVFGARTCLGLEDRFAGRVLEQWSA